jgi:hypothetical protein
LRNKKSNTVTFVRKKLEIEETVPNKISGNVYVLFADAFCTNNKKVFSENQIKDIKNLQKGKTMKIHLPKHNLITIKVYEQR